MRFRIIDSDIRFQPPRTIGSWHAHKGGRPACNVKLSVAEDIVRLPSVWALGCKASANSYGPVDWILQDREASEGPKRCSLKEVSTPRETRHKKRRLARSLTDQESTQMKAASLDGLPNELLISILAYVLPSRRTFHFSTAGHKGIMKGISVYQLCALNDDPQLGTLSSLALSCSRLKNVSYSLFYTENKFIVDLASIPLTTTICGNERVAKERGHVDITFGSWSRFIFADGDSPVMPPILSTNIVQHLKTLTLCITLPAESDKDVHGKDKPRARRVCLASREDTRDLVGRVASAISNSSCKLQKICVHLGMTRLTGYPFNANLSAGGFRLCEDTSAKAGVGIEMEQTLQYHKPRYDSVLEPLLSIRGVKEVHISGLVSDAFAADLRENMTGVADGTSAVRDEKSSKKRRVE